MSQSMLEDYSQINDINPFRPGVGSLLPGMSNADVDFKAPPDVPEPPAQWETEPASKVCEDGEVHLGCDAPVHCPLKRSAHPNYDIEDGRWSLSGAECARKSRGMPPPEVWMPMLIALVAVAIYYLRKR